MPRRIVNLVQGCWRHGNTQFLAQFPHGGREVIFARIHMSGTRRTQQPWAIIFGIRTPLEAEQSITPEPEDMNRSME